ncbi:hypothetical protein [Siphonobacter sp.]|uniref:hypothetical protein n=1 Tax=Siphonobacter sp. TaxID=1869184 RepID=UPI003B3ADA0D
MEASKTSNSKTQMKPSFEQLLTDYSDELATIATKYIHSNPAQMVINALCAKTSIAIWGRNSGKTETVLSTFFYRVSKAMPRGTSALVSTTYTRLLEMVIPALQRGWERIGLKEGIHYWMNKYPDLPGVPRPYRRPGDPKHCIFWWNGHVTHMVSLDRKSLANGLRTQAIGGDECRLWNYDSFAESILPTFGGNQEHFGDLPEYCSLCLVTDMPRDPGGKWLFNYEKEMNESLIGAILVLQDKIARLKLKAKELKDQAKAIPDKLQRSIKRWEKWIAKLRRKCVYISYASTLDNIHTVPLETLKQYRRSLSPLEFDFSVLNKKMTQVENCFYGFLSPNNHGYYNTNYEYIDSLPKGQEFKRNWKCDKDVNPYKPLDLSFDYNNKCSNLAIGQVQYGEAKFLNHLWALNPLLLTDLVEKFNEYYKDFPTKKVRYIYDHTALVKNADTNESFAMKVEKKLKELGWQVEAHYIGQATEHQERHQMWGDLFKGLKALKFRYNRDTCKHWQIAALQTETKYRETKKGIRFAKDKSSERSSLIPPYEATHITEALDALIVFYLRTAAKAGYVPVADSIG